MRGRSLHKPALHEINAAQTLQENINLKIASRFARAMPAYSPRRPLRLQKLNMRAQ